jgi:pyrroline-5-carboxylate reductase
MKLGILGCGKMGSALLKGVLDAGVVVPSDVLVFDVYPAAAQQLRDTCRVEVAESGAAVVSESEAILLCVKPQDLSEMLANLPDASASKLFISIAAGVTLRSIAASLPGGSHRLIRVMPNTPALIGKGASAYALGESTTAEDAAFVEQLLSAVGTVEQVKEALLDAVTGLSGSGPAYIYTIIEALADGGVLVGLPKDKALRLAAQTVAGAAEMVLLTGEHPAKLRDQVTSPGGTTIMGLDVLEAAGLRSALIRAVKAATERARELGAS